MTQYAIRVPSLTDEDKTIDFDGAIACGEHAQVTVVGTGLYANEANDSDAPLRIRFRVFDSIDVAMFPMPGEETDEAADDAGSVAEWETGEEEDSLVCEISLDTEQMVKAFRNARDVSYLRGTVVVERRGGDSPQLYGVGPVTLYNWPRRTADPTHDNTHRDLYSLLAKQKDLDEAKGDINTLKGSIETEEMRPKTAEQTLSDAIDDEKGVVEGLSDSITKETKRAETQEVALKSLIDSEATRAKQAEGELKTKIDNLPNPLAKVEEEQERAKHAEDDIDDALKNEIKRSTDKDEEHDKKLDSALFNADLKFKTYKQYAEVEFTTTNGAGNTSIVTTPKLPQASATTAGIITADEYKLLTDTSSELAKKADLVDGKIPAAQLPSYVDDVLQFASRSAFPSSGESGKIYIAADTNLTYRWAGTSYVEISPSLALGETSSTAYPGDRGAALRRDIDSHIADDDVHITEEKKAEFAALRDDVASLKEEADAIGLPSQIEEAATQDMAYLLTTGKTFINLGIKTNESMRYEIKFSYPESLLSMSPSDLSTYGYWILSSVYQTFTADIVQRNTPFAYVGVSTVNRVKTIQGFTFGNYGPNMTAYLYNDRELTEVVGTHTYVIDVPGDRTRFDDNDWVGGHNSRISGESAGPLTVFARYLTSKSTTAVGGGVPAGSKLYYLRVYENDVLTHNYVPFLDSYTNKAGLRDTETGDSFFSEYDDEYPLKAEFEEGFNFSRDPAAVARRVIAEQIGGDARDGIEIRTTHGDWGLDVLDASDTTDPLISVSTDGIYFRSKRDEEESVNVSHNGIHVKSELHDVDTMLYFDEGLAPEAGKEKTVAKLADVKEVRADLESLQDEIADIKNKQAAVEEALDEILAGESIVLPDSAVYVKNETTGMSHKISIETNEAGQSVLAVEQNGVER